MPELVYERARREAAQLLETCWDGSFPVRLMPFTSELDAEVYQTDLGNGLSGVVSKDAGQSARIVLNSRHVNRRNRFTWAHELGHIVERSSVANDDEYSFEELQRGGGYDLHEFFADEFAGALLMPQWEIQQIDWWPVEQIADYFDVSIDAVKKRLARLKKHPE